MLKMPLGAYLADWAVIWFREILSQSSQPMLSQSEVIGMFARVLAACSQKYRLAAGSTLKGWHLQVRQFWGKTPLVVAVSHLHLHLPLNNSYISEKNNDNSFKETMKNSLATYQHASKAPLQPISGYPKKTLKIDTVRRSKPIQEYK